MNIQLALRGEKINFCIVQRVKGYCESKRKNFTAY